MLVALFNLYKNTRTQLDHVLTQLQKEHEGESPDKGRLGYSPYDEITDFLQAHRNYFPALEEAAARIRRDHALEPRLFSDDLVRVLRARRVRVEMVEARVCSGVPSRIESDRDIAYRRSRIR